MRNFIFKLKILFIPCQENNYKPRFLESEVLLYFVIGLLVLKIIAVTFFIYLPRTVFFADITKGALIEFTNQEREGLGLSVLEENSKLDQAAYQKAMDMINNDYFSHYSPSGISPWYWFKQAGYNYRIAGENLAIGFVDSEEVFRAWLNSPSHKANLVNNKFNETGMAVLEGNFNGAKTTVVVQLFGSPYTEIPIKESAVVKQEEPAVKQEEPATSSVPQETVTTTVAVAGEEEKVAGVVKSEFSLSQSKPEENNFEFNFVRFMALNYPKIIEEVIFYSLLIITIALILNILIKIKIQDRNLIVKTALFILLMILFVISDKEFILRFIPHNLII
ncbi:MAG: CAP domain-containing protein [Candidatus Paceibacterota bacterium]